MKILFLIFHGFDEANGISKKIRYQVKALRECGADVRVCWLNDTNGKKRRMLDDTVLQDYGTGIKGKILKRTGLNCIARYVRENEIRQIYIRSDHNTTPFLINLLRKLKKMGCKIVMEIPTYPYDQEYKGLPFGYQRVLFADKCLRRFMAMHIDKVVTFSNHETIFGRPTIRIANGIDFDAVSLKKNTYPGDGKLHLIAVATIHPWHGFDRAIRGMATYVLTHQNVVLHIVGQGVPAVTDEYHQLVRENHLEESVVFHGSLFGDALDEIFNLCQLGIGSLARHRSGITHLRSLKNREYAARGIPFVYSEIDDDFEEMPYVMKIPADESPLDIQKVINFYHSITLTPEEIRTSILEKLSWKTQMQQVIKSL
ncbi:MAG: glycosyltransferase family 4 protein [Bacteroides nordii]